MLTEASIVQAEAGSVEDMGKVARVLDNRLADGMPLQLDTTVNYANGKSGITTTPQDRQNPSPYNTYVHPGLPPGPISNPGEEALRAVLTPTPGDWLFFVVVDPDTGETRFAATARGAPAERAAVPAVAAGAPRRMSGSGPRPPGVATRSRRCCTGRRTRRSG